MAEPSERVQDAVAAYLEHLEMGGPAPDLSHLSDAEQARARELIELLEQTEGVAFGAGLEERLAAAPATASEEGARVLEAVRAAVPASARIAADPSPAEVDEPGVLEAWTVGTFGGRIRVWALAEADALARSAGWLRSLERVFRAFPDTVALALVEPDLSCLLVQPEDCAPQIEVPRGALVARRYSRPVMPVADALTVFLRELIPSWEPVPAMTERTPAPIDLAPVASERARAAIEEQVATGGRARKTNPKRAALTGLGEAHADALAELVLGVHDGRVAPDAVDEALRELAKR